MFGIVRMRARDLKGSFDGGSAVHGSKVDSGSVLGGSGEVVGSGPRADGYASSTATG